MKSTSSYLSYRFIWWFVSVIPSSAAYSLSRLTAKFIFSRNGKGVKRLRSNYQTVNPNLPNLELEKLTKAGLISYWRYWCDTFRLNKWDKDQIVNGVAVTNEHLLVDAVNSKRGCLVALPHAGNWDHAGAYFCQIGIPLTTVAEKLEPEKIFLKFLEYRQRIGMEILNHKEKTIPTLTDRLKAGKLVALVADRDLSKSGVEVQFFGRTAKMPAGPAILWLQTGAAFITAYVSYREKGIHIQFDEVSEAVLSNAKQLPDQSSAIKMITQEIAKNFERRIKESPVDWHMLQRIWIDPQ
jgi:lauroyl/myristoyl acyltransferase